MFKKLLSKFSVFVSIFALTTISVSATFSDVGENLFYYDSVNFLEEQGIVEGYSDGTFGYDKNINRAEMLKILLESRLMKIDQENIEDYAKKSCFKDVPANEWYTKYVCFAKEQGYIDGYPDGTFKPAENVNFVEAVKMLVTVNGVAHYPAEEYPEGTEWFRPYVDAASSANTIPLTIKSFDQQITRAEMADMVTRQYHHDMVILEDFLGDKSDFTVTYDTIEQGTDLKKKYEEYQKTIGSVTLPPGCDLPDSTDCELEIWDPIWYLQMSYLEEGTQLEGFYYPLSEEYHEFTEDSGIRDYLVSNYVIPFSEGVFQDGILYFSNDFYLDSEGESIGKGDTISNILAYDVEDDSYEVFYEYKSEGDLYFEQNVMHLWGVDTENEYLIVSLDPADFSPGPCYSVWLDPVAGTMYALDIKAEDKELKEYKTPAWKLKQEKNWEDWCADNIESFYN